MEVCFLFSVFCFRRGLRLIRRRQWQPTPLFFPGKSHGRSLVGCSPWGRKESDTTEQLHFHVLKKEMATHSSVLTWRIPGMGEPGRLPSIGLNRVGHDWSDLAAAARLINILKIFLWKQGKGYVMKRIRLSEKAHREQLSPFWSSINECSAAAKSLQSCPTLRDPIDCSLPGSSVHGIFQKRTGVGHRKWVLYTCANRIC